MAKGLGSLACTTLHCENPRGSVCSCCSFITGNIDMLQFSCSYHQNSETISSTIILLTYKDPCILNVVWNDGMPNHPKYFSFFIVELFCCIQYELKNMFTFCVSSDCGSFKWLQKQLQSEKFWDTFTSWGALMYLLQEKNLEMHHKNLNFLLLPLSPVSSQSLLTESVASSQADSTAVDKTVPETEGLQGWCLVFSDRTHE